jgi:hypothetical protein
VLLFGVFFHEEETGLGEVIDVEEFSERQFRYPNR